MTFSNWLPKTLIKQEQRTWHQRVCLCKPAQELNVEVTNQVKGAWTCVNIPSCCCWFHLKIILINIIMFLRGIVWLEWLCVCVCLPLSLSLSESSQLPKSSVISSVSVTDKVSRPNKSNMLKVINLLYMSGATTLILIGNTICKLEGIDAKRNSKSLHCAVSPL